MKRIKINTATQYTNAAKFQQTAERLIQMKQELFQSYVRLDLDIRSKQELGERAYDAIRELQMLAEQLEQMGNYLNTAAQRLEDSDIQGGTGIEKASSPTQPYLPACSGSMQGINTWALALWFGGVAGVAMLPITTGLGWIKGIISGSAAGKSVPQEPLKTGYIPAAWLHQSVREKVENSNKIPSESVAEPPVSQARPVVEVGSDKSVWPVSGGKFDPQNGFGVKRSGVSTDFPNGHVGIDIWPAQKGIDGDPIIAAVGGTVVRAEKSESYGNVVYMNTVIDGKNYQVRYAHMMDNSLGVTEGDKIDAGSGLGKMGNTGMSSGTHLHFEVRESLNGKPCPRLGNDTSKPIDPIPFLEKLGMKL